MISAGLALQTTKTSAEKATTTTRRAADIIVKLLPELQPWFQLKLQLQLRAQLQVQESSLCSLQIQHTKLVPVSSYQEDPVVPLPEPNRPQLLTQLLFAPTRPTSTEQQNPV